MKARIKSIGKDTVPPFKEVGQVFRITNIKTFGFNIDRRHGKVAGNLAYTCCIYNCAHLNGGNWEIIND